MNGSQEVSFFWLYIHFPTDDYFWESKKGSNKTENTKFWEDHHMAPQPSVNIYIYILNNNAAFAAKQDDPCREMESVAWQYTKTP